MTDVVTTTDGYGITWCDAERMVLRVERVDGPTGLGPVLMAAAARVPEGAVYIDVTDVEQINDDLDELDGAEAVAAGRWPVLSDKADDDELGGTTATEE